MDYKAYSAYKSDEAARLYERTRFSSLKGKLVDWREKRLVLRALAALGVTAPCTILDVPCGTGRISRYLAANGFTVEGVDVSEAMVAHAKTKSNVWVSGGQIRFSVQNASSLSFSDDFFEASICIRLFGHTPQPVRLAILNELRRVSKTGVVVAYYLSECVAAFLRRRRRLRAGIEWHPVSRGEAIQEVLSSGLKPVRLFPLASFLSETLVIAAGKARCL